MSSKPAPKGLRENLRYRRKILERAAGDRAFQQEIWLRCKLDPVWYTDVFGWTYSPKDYPEAPNRPFILYDYQEEALERILAAMGKHDLLLEKSRDMGATWLALVAIEHRWHFYTRQSFLLGSRKEELVDKSGDSKSLFWKIDYLLENQPGWLRPNVNRIKLHLHNEDNNSAIDGESTNDDFARGDRRTLIFPDEFPAVENGYSILKATRDATNCRLFNGTPQGAAGAYYDTRRKMEKSNPDRIIRLHWSLHPEKRRGLYRLLPDGGYEIIDRDYEFPPDYKFTDVSYPRFTLRSIWFNEQCERAASEQEIAQELEIDYAASGWQFFDPKKIEAIEDRCARPPSHVGELIFDGDGNHAEWMDQEGGRLQLWFSHFWTIPELVGTAPARREFVVSADVATGKGGEMSSNSVLSIADKSTGEKVGQFTSNRIAPQELAVYAVALCRWLNEAFFIWEENGPGGEVTTKVKELGYRNVFYREDETSFIRKKTRKPGWSSTKETKRLLLSNYFKALLEGTFTNYCREAIRECGEYVHHPNGSIIHARSTGHEDPTASGENHGDMVIADALANRGLADTPASETSAESEVSPHSFLGRRLEAVREQARTAGW